MLPLAQSLCLNNKLEAVKMREKETNNENVKKKF